MANEYNYRIAHTDRHIYDFLKQAEIIFRHRNPFLKSGYNVFGISRGKQELFIHGPIEL